MATVARSTTRTIHSNMIGNVLKIHSINLLVYAIPFGLGKVGSPSPDPATA